MTRKGKERDIAGINSFSWGIINKDGERLQLPKWARSGRGYDRLVVMALEQGKGVSGLLTEMKLQKEYLTLHRIPVDERRPEVLERLDQLDRLLLSRD